MRVRGGKLEIRKRLRRELAEKDGQNVRMNSCLEIKVGHAARGRKERINAATPRSQKGADRSNERTRPDPVPTGSGQVGLSPTSEGNTGEKTPHAHPAHEPPKFVFGFYVRVTRPVSGTAHEPHLPPNCGHGDRSLTPEGGQHRLLLPRTVQ
jgi:hypothetical protein